MIACELVNSNTVTFYQFTVAALLAIESLLLTVFGSIFGVYALYKTLEENGREAYITRTIIYVCRYLVGITIFIATFTAYILHQITCQPQINIPIAVSAPLFAITLAILAPTIWLAIKMR